MLKLMMLYIFAYAKRRLYLVIYYLAMAITYIKIFIFKPWWMACFYAAWSEYSSTPVYRERLVCFGMAQAIYGFIKSKFEQKYCLKLRLQKEPLLYWKILFLPFSIDIPKDLIIASREGYFDTEVKFNII